MALPTLRTLGFLRNFPGDMPFWLWGARRYLALGFLRNAKDAVPLHMCNNLFVIGHLSFDKGQITNQDV